MSKLFSYQQLHIINSSFNKGVSAIELVNPGEKHYEYEHQMTRKPCTFLSLFGENPFIYMVKALSRYMSTAKYYEYLMIT